MRQRVALGELLAPASDEDRLGASAWWTTDCGCGPFRVQDGGSGPMSSAWMRVPWD